MTEKDIIGKRIEKIEDIEVNGHIVRIVSEQSTCLDCSTSDGGYFCWNIIYNNEANVQSKTDCLRVAQFYGVLR